MAMFLGKISTERKTSPSRISNSLPKGIIYINGSYYRVDKDGNKVEVTVKKADKSFSSFFGLEESKQPA